MRRCLSVHLSVYTRMQAVLKQLQHSALDCCITSGWQDRTHELTCWGKFQQKVKFAERTKQIKEPGNDPPLVFCRHQVRICAFLDGIERLYSVPMLQYMNRLKCFIIYIKSRRFRWPYYFMYQRSTSDAVDLFSPHRIWTNAALGQWNFALGGFTTKCVPFRRYACNLRACVCLRVENII